MRILHYASHFSLPSETFIYDEIQMLEKIFPKANTVLTSERHLETERPFPRVVVVAQESSTAQSLQRRVWKVFHGKKISRDFFPLCAVLDLQLSECDLVQAHFGWNAVTLWQALKQLGREREKPLLVRCHGSDINSNPVLNSAYRRELLELAAADNVLLTGHSEFLRDKMRRLGVAAEKIHPVTNSFNPHFRATFKQHRFKTGDCLKLVNTARFVGWKGQAVLVKAFAQFVREINPNCRLTLVGEGPTLDEIKALARAEGVVERINFTGSLPHHALAAVLAENDLYVQPSICDPKTFQEEGLPIAVLEALAVGLPLIVTRTGGMPEIVGFDNHFARIVSPNDAPILCEAIRSMWSSGVLSEDISEFANQRLQAFTPARQLNDLLSVYEKMLGRIFLSEMCSTKENS